jgi:uncharacterized protein YuzB (UPF0349 family)
MGFIIIEVCDYNLLSAEELEEVFGEYPEVAVMPYECLNLCGLCRIRPYALINGERIFAKTREECIEKITAKVRELLEEYQF